MKPTDFVKVVPTHTEFEGTPSKLVVGLCPNRHRWQIGDRSDVALDSQSISGRIIHAAVDDVPDVWLTNLTNWTLDPKRLNEDLVAEGIAELEALCVKIKPVRIVCLGKQIFDRLIELWPKARMYSLHHPAFVNRFHHAEVPKYIQLIQEIVSCRLP